MHRSSGAWADHASDRPDREQRVSVRHEDAAGDGSQSAPEPELVVDHEHAELTCRDAVYGTVIRRLIRNTGAQLVTQYLVRIAVDKFPGDPDRSNALFRGTPLTWEEICLSAACGNEPMTWRVRYDRDAFKEVWLLFENPDGRFPLYPGESTWISYVESPDGTRARHPRSCPGGATMPT